MLLLAILEWNEYILDTFHQHHRGIEQERLRQRVLGSWGGPDRIKSDGEFREAWLLDMCREGVQRAWIIAFYKDNLVMSKGGKKKRTYREYMQAELKIELLDRR